MHLLETVPPHRLLPAWLREGLCGFVYWLLFLLVLEPDNLLRASHAGYPLAFGHEALRITIAALLGASVTPMVLTLTRRFPMLGSGRWRNVLIHCVGTTGLALALILISCLLAAWGFYAEWLPTLAEVRHELVANGPLLIYALFAFTAIAHAVHYFSHAADAPSVVLRAEYLSQVPVKMHGRLSYLELANVDWIETQGNYLGLHVGSSVHLIRETLQTFEEKLDPNRFVRIHRRAVVAVDRIRDLRSATNGDATLRLMDGQELRVSRRYRKDVAEKWPG